MLKDLVARLIAVCGYKLMRDDPSVYSADGLRSVHNHDFVRDPGFARAYARGVAAAGVDYDWQWRVHIGLWAATSAARLEGDFVECGTWKGGAMGMMALATLKYGKTRRHLHLFDAFEEINLFILILERIFNRVIL